MSELLATEDHKQDCIDIQAAALRQMKLERDLHTVVSSHLQWSLMKKELMGP